MFLFGRVGIAFARKEDNARKPIDRALRSVGRSIEMFHQFDTKTINQLIREFGIKYKRYIFCCVALVGKIAIRLLSNLTQQSIVSYPEFT